MMTDDHGRVVTLEVRHNDAEGYWYIESFATGENGTNRNILFERFDTEEEARADAATRMAS